MSDDVASKNTSNVADHLHPCMPLSPDATSMTVSLAPFGMPDRYERLIIVPSPIGDYVVACLPFFTYGVQFGDHVRIRQPGNLFERVLRPCGLRTFRFAFNDPAEGDSSHEELRSKMVASGLPHEWRGSGFVAVLLKNHADQVRLLSLLTEYLEDGRGRWEVDPEPFVKGDSTTSPRSKTAAVAAKHTTHHSPPTPSAKPDSGTENQ